MPRSSRPPSPIRSSTSAIPRDVRSNPPSSAWRMWMPTGIRHGSKRIPNIKETNDLMPPATIARQFGPTKSQHMTYSLTAQRQRAYQYLGVSPNDVLAAPKIAPFIHDIPGGFDFTLKCLRASSDPLARVFLK